MRGERGRRHGIFLIALLLLSMLAGADAGECLTMPPVTREVLPNGLIVLVFEDHALPLVTLQLLVDAGSWRDPPERAGLANLRAQSALRGTATRSAVAIDEELDFLGSSISPACDRDFATFTMQVLRKDLERGGALFFESLLRPAFPEEEVQRELDRVLAVLRAAEDDPATVADRAFHEALFQSSPYGHPVEGTAQSLAGVTREELARFHDSYYRPNGSILAIGGDVTAAEVKALFGEALSAWQRQEIPQTPFSGGFAEGPRTQWIERRISQANIVLGNPGLDRASKDYYAVSVMNFILGGSGFGSRLLEEIRVKRGLAYSVASIFIPRRHPGAFQVMVQTKNASADEAISLVLLEMERMQRELVSEGEIATARKALIAGFPQRFDSQAKMASFLNQVEYFGLGLDYPEKYPALINAVSRADVMRAAKSYLHPAKVVVVVVGAKGGAAAK